MKNFLKIIVLVSHVWLSAVALALAADDQDINIEKIVVTASRTPQDIQTATKYTSVITQDDIARSNAQTIPDLLRNIPGVTVRDYSGNGKQVNIDMRGFGETGPSNMLVLIDGRRVNAIDLSNTDWSQISLSQVDRIEVVRGSSSILYGDNADGGVINIITKKGSGTPKLSIEQKGGSFDTSTTSFTSSGNSNASSFRISGERFVTEGYRKNNSLDRWDFGLQLAHEFSPLLEANLTTGYHQDHYGLPGALKESEINSLGRRATTKPDDSAKSDDEFANLQIASDFDQAGKLTTDISVRTRSATSSYIASSWKNENYIITFGCTPKYTLKGAIAGKENTLIAGGDFYFAQDNILDGALTGPNDKIEITKNSPAIYLQDELKITDRFLIKGGYRRDMAQYNFRQITQVELKEKSRLTQDVFNTGVSYLTGDNGSIYFDYSTGFRDPLIDEFFVSNTYGFGGLNASLKAQTGKNIEAGVRHQFSGSIQTNINLFRQDIKNEIFFDPLTFVNANYDKTVHQGVTGDASIKLSEKWSIFANYTYTLAQFAKGPYQDKKIPAVPEHKASAGVGWTPIQSWRLNLLVNYIGSMYLISDQANVYPKLDGYVTLDANVNVDINGFGLFLALNNIFDAEYSEYAVVSTFSGTRNFYPAPGRNVMAGVRCKF